MVTIHLFCSGGTTYETRTSSSRTTRTRPVDDGRSGWWYNCRGLEQYAEKGAQQQQAAQAQAAQQQQVADLQTQQAQLAAQQQALAQQQAAAAQPAAAAPAGSSLDDQLVQIQKLSVMKDQGLITEEEFAAKKKQILGL